MAKVVFTAKRSPRYDDLVEERYHFPATYLRQVEAALGDWIVYYEPRRPGSSDELGGAQSYFATARVERLTADERRAGHYYAFVSQYLQFDHAVPFREDGRYAERALRKSDGSTNKGAFGRSVRPLPEEEYDAILTRGFASLLDPASAVSSGGDRWAWTTPFREAERPRVAAVGERWFRDRAFTARVRDVYGNRCAFTGLRILNGGGRPEVQAAHIRPVASDGPDSTRNGIALSSTVHWMFDRGLISLADDGRILLANDGVPDEARRLLVPDLHALLPMTGADRPHPQFLRFHRAEVFKG